MDIKEIRRSRLVWLAERYGGYKSGGFSGLGQFVGKDPNYFSQIYTRVRGMGHQTARLLEAKHGLAHGTMDAPLPQDKITQHITELVRAALGSTKIDPEHKGMVKRQPGPIASDAIPTGSRVKGGTKEVTQPARRAVQKTKRRGAK